jgi:putative tryptophan/tyrosine transport system substrate-binding protein
LDFRKIAAFVEGGDVALNGIVKNIAQPEGNATGIANLFYSIGGKWLELLKEAVPSLEKAAVIYDRRINDDSGARSDIGYAAAIEAAARVLGVHIERIESHEPLVLVRAVDRFAAEPNGGLIIIPALPPPRRPRTDQSDRSAASVANDLRGRRRRR